MENKNRILKQYLLCFIIKLILKRGKFTYSIYSVIHLSYLCTMSKTVVLHTLGCKLNYSETSTLAGLFRQRGYKLIQNSAHNNKADIFVLNTCTVTENADKECRQIIRSVLNKNPDTYVIVTGCYAQLEANEIASIQGVDLILGNNEKFKIFDYLDDQTKNNYSCIKISPSENLTNFDYAFTSDSDSRTRAFLKIQDGCDYNCSFCTIPLARGKSRSLPIDKVIENAKHLIDSGYKEIVLTGVNTGDYSYYSSEKFNEYKIIDVLYELEKLNIERIRISSIEPNLLTDNIIQFVKSSNKFCKHFHIPLQSGDAEILKLMRRRYYPMMFKELIQKLIESIHNVGIGIDVITGFPGESEEHFENTTKFINELEISYLHVFTYSERNNTNALSLNNTVEIQERKHRSKILRKLSAEKRLQFFKKNLGQTRNVLYETVRDDKFLFGYTDNYIKVRTNPLRKLENEIISSKIIAIIEPNCCEVELQSYA